MSMCKTALMAGAALIAGISAASASTITYTGSYGFATTNFTPQSVAPPIAQFNPLLGTLDV
jgi:hypothetical protein